MPTCINHEMSRAPERRVELGFVGPRSFTPAIAATFSLSVTQAAEFNSAFHECRVQLGAPSRYPRTMFVPPYFPESSLNNVRLQYFERQVAS